MQIDFSLKYLHQNSLLLVLVFAALIAVELSTVIGNDLLQPPREMEERDGWVDQFGKKWNWDGCLNGKKK